MWVTHESDVQRRKLATAVGYTLSHHYDMPESERRCVRRVILPSCGREINVLTMFRRRHPKGNECRQKSEGGGEKACICRRLVPGG